jgi:hypothetical protein
MDIYRQVVGQLLAKTGRKNPKETAQEKETTQRKKGK